MESKIQFLDTARKYIARYGSIDKAMEETRKLIDIYDKVMKNTGPYYSYSRDEYFINREVYYRLHQIKNKVWDNEK